MDICGNLIQCRKELEDLEERLARLRSGMTSGVTRLSDRPKGCGRGDRMAEYAAAVQSLEAQWQRAQTKSAAYIQALEAQLDACEDPLVRLAVRLKYESGLTWQQVAQQTGSTKDSLRMLVKRYFAAL